MSQLTQAEATYQAVRHEAAQLSAVRLAHRYRKLRRQTSATLATTEQLVELAALRHAMQARGMTVPQ